MKKKLQISKNLKDLPTIKLSEVHDIQGNLKDLTEDNYNKLLRRLEKVGFKYPLYLWKSNGKVYNLDGNQRQRVIEAEFGDIELPYILIEAKNKVEAKKEIMAISSEYGKATKDGFDEFTAEFTEEDFEDIKFDTTFEWLMDIEFSDEELDDFFENDDSEPKPDQQSLCLHYTEEDLAKVKQAIEDIGGTPELVLWNLLELE